MTDPDDDLPDDCQHEWEVQDESFDHEFGTEVAVFAECQKCGAEVWRPEYNGPWSFDEKLGEWTQDPL